MIREFCVQPLCMIMHSAEVHATNAPVTCNGAYQFGMEDETGSLEAGKLTDFVVLDRNPLKVDAADIRIVSGEATVFRGLQAFTGGDIKFAE